MCAFVYSQVMFDEYNCAGVYIAIQAVLTLYAQGMSRDYHVTNKTTPQFTLLYSLFIWSTAKWGGEQVV